jgi:hypothetical protein
VTRSVLAALAALLPRPATKTSGAFIDMVFNWCVDLLSAAASRLGISYNEINVWVFCVVWPLLTIALVGAVIAQRRRIRSLTLVVPRTAITVDGARTRPV